MTDLQLNTLCQYLEYFLSFYYEKDDDYSFGAACFIRSLLERIYSDYFLSE